MRILVAVFEQSFWTLPSDEVDRLRRLLPDDDVVHARTAEELAAALPDADVLLTARLSREEFALAARLQWMHSSAAGVGNLLHPELVQSPIPLTNSRGAHAVPIAEHAIALILALRRSLHVALARQHERQWAQIEIYERLVPTLDETVLAVVGLGAIGSLIARHASGLGMTVLGVRRDASAPIPAGVAEVVGQDRLSDVLSRADAVVLALPHIPHSRPILGANEFAVMKRGALVINVARGQLIDDRALAEALSSGHLGGAGLDAFVPEPLPATSPLWGLPNVIITPHTAAFGDSYWRPAVDLFIENVRRFKAGEPLLNVVDKVRGY
jgi:phosphoglycerate dehydrogenase-like enzyme